ncbi:MAG: hypothetical protein K0R65_2496 [Crocinitomicaceae bacterium]|jgi:hypothetical protein|nr:hypothetical protein [Crocinitomicaceae bacterium]
MDFGLYTTFFLLSTIKFLFTPFGGPIAGMNFWETYISCVGGAIFSAAVFYYASEYFMKRAKAKRTREKEEALKNGTELKPRKVFTKMNKFIVRIKRRFGIYGISLFAPLFLSVPIGSIITAKFYGKEKRTFFLVVAGMFMNGFITTGLAYFGHSLF